MQHGDSYKLNAEVVGLVMLTEHPRTSLMIPKEGVVTVVSKEPINGGRVVDVTWDGKTIMIFAQDLRERGELVQGAAT
jgi:hypothetical protein